MLCCAITRRCPASPIVLRSVLDNDRHRSMEAISSCMEPAGNSQPVSSGTTSSGMPAIYVLSTGRRSAMASMITTGRPSAKLGSTRARAARISVRTALLSIHPVIRMQCSRPCCLISRSSSGRNGPSPARTSSMRRPRACSSAIALDQQQLTLGFTQPPDTHQAIGMRGLGPWGGEVIRLQPTVDDLDSLPLFVRAVEQQLTTRGKAA